MELQILQLLGLFPGSVSGISSMQYLNQASPTPISGDITDEVESVNVDPVAELDWIVNIDWILSYSVFENFMNTKIFEFLRINDTEYQLLLVSTVQLPNT